MPRSSSGGTRSRESISSKLVPCGFTTSVRRGERGRSIGSTPVNLALSPSIASLLDCLIQPGSRQIRPTPRSRSSGDVYRELYLAEPALQHFTFATLSTRLFELMTLLQETASFDLEQRVAAFLLRRSGSGHVLETTHEQVAHHLGSSREVVSRVLRNLARSGAIRLSPGSVAIVDADKLRSAVE